MLRLENNLQLSKVRGVRRVQAATSTNVSVRTMRNTLRERNIRPGRPPGRPRLTQAHPARRRCWAMINSRWNNAQLSNLSFPDKYWFILLSNDGWIPDFVVRKSTLQMRRFESMTDMLVDQ